MRLILPTAILFLLLLMLPVMAAEYWYIKGRGSRKTVLSIRQSQIKDPRYFAHAFRTLFLKAWEESDGSTLTLHKAPEAFLRTDDLTEQTFPRNCDQLLAAEAKDLRTPANACLQKEIFAWTSVIIHPGNVLRAVHAEKNLELAAGTQVIRWADAEGPVTTGANCNLGISLSSGTEIHLGLNCRFRRLFAPVIQVGKKTEAQKRPHSAVLGISAAQIRRHRIRRSHMDEDGTLKKSVLSAGKLWIDSNLIIQGSLRAISGIRVGKNAIICGNLFCDGDIYLQKGCRVLGNVFSQGDIICEPGVEIGSAGEIRSVIARGRITLEEGCRVYGYVSSEGPSICAPRGCVHKKQRAATPCNLLTAAAGTLRRRCTGITVVAVFLAFLSAGSLLAAFLCQRLMIPSQRKDPVSREILYANQGLEAGIPLAREPCLITVDRVEFPDRILLRCSWSSSQEFILIRHLNHFAKKLTAEFPAVRLYCMVAPLRIGFEENYGNQEQFAAVAEKEKKALRNLEERMEKHLAPQYTCIPLMELFSQKKEEYIFFRGAPAWTARGSYYAAQAFLKAADLPGFSIENFYESARTKGSCILPHTASDPPADRRYVYLREDYNPMVENLSSGEKSPMYSSIRSSYSAFMGGSYGIGAMEGLGDNGRVLLIVGCKNAQVLAPWMVMNFEKILYLNMDVFLIREDPFWALFDQYAITDCLIVHDADTISKEYLSRKYSHLADSADPAAS